MSSFFKEFSHKELMYKYQKGYRSDSIARRHIYEESLLSYSAQIDIIFLLLICTCTGSFYKFSKEQILVNVCHSEPPRRKTNNVVSDQV